MKPGNRSMYRHGAKSYNKLLRDKKSEKITSSYEEVIFLADWEVSEGL